MINPLCYTSPLMKEKVVNAADGSVHGHDGELIKGPTWVDGQFGKALEFDGTEGQHVIGAYQ